MLNSFRSMAGSLWAKALLLLLVLSFGVWGIGDMLRAPGAARSVASVGGLSISAREFQQELHRETENMREVLGDRYSPEAIRSLGLPPQVLQKLIGRKLLALESASLGLVPDDAAVVRRIRSNQGFQDKNGNFDKKIFEATLRNNNLAEKNYIDRLRDDMAIGLLLDTLLSKTPVSDTAARTLLAARDEQRTATLYILSPALVTDVPQPTDEEVAAYYHEHQSEFTAPETRTVSYVVFSPADMHKGETVTEAQLRAAYKDRLDDFKRPERRTVEQLLYSSQEQAAKAAGLLKSGKSVADVAKAEPPLNKDALSLGKVGRTEVLASAADAVFALKAGETSEPVSSPFGWHVFHVSTVEPPSTASFEEVRPQLEKELKQQNADESQNKMASKIEDDLAGGASLEEVATGLGLKLTATSAFTRQAGKEAGLPDLDRFNETAFKTDEKTVSSLIPAKGGSYYLLRTDKVTPERLRPLAEVKSLVTAGWQKQERARRLSQLAADLSKSFATPAGRNAAIAKYNLTALSAAAIKQNSRMIGEVSVPPDLVGAVFSRAPGSSTDAAMLKDGTYAIAVVDNIIPAASAKASDLADMRHSLENTVGNEILDEYSRYLMSKYRVTINEAALQAVAP